jgi:hypothetical protein
VRERERERERERAPTAGIRRHTRSSFANSGKFTKFKCKIGRHRCRSTPSSGRLGAPGKSVLDRERENASVGGSAGRGQRGKEGGPEEERTVGK